VRFGVALDAFADSDIGLAPETGSNAKFLFSFNASTIETNSSGGGRLIPLPDATWTLVDMNVPEPSMAGLIAGLAVLGLLQEAKGQRV
jgi:hypothetical protein